MKNSKLNVIAVLLMALLITSCNKAYQVSQSKELSNKHEQIAILLPTISYAQSGQLNPKQMEETSSSDALQFQNEMVSWMLKRKKKSQANFTVQNTKTTNSLISRAGVNTDDATAEELAKILGVDAVIFSNFTLSQPFTLLESVAASELLGLPAATSKAEGQMSIYDRSTNQDIWSYSNKQDNSWDPIPVSSPADMVDKFMRKASKRMPY